MSRDYTDSQLRKMEINAARARTRAERYASDSALKREALRAGKTFSNVTDRISAAGYATQTGTSAYNTFKPLVVAVIIFLFFIGPGLSAVLAIFGTLNIWIWVGLILLGLMLWRAV